MDILITVTILGGILLNFAQSTVSESSDNTRILQYYSGALTSITCSTTTPRFLINGLYAPQHYDLLPGLFGIKAVIASDRSNVTLHVNGSTMAHNVTIECQNIIDPITGGSESMFQLTLLFTDPIPAPHGVQYNTNDGILHWSPPRTEEMPHNSNVSVALRITHYIIYITDLQTGLLMTNFTTTSPDTNIAILDAMSEVPCSMSIQVSAVNPAGEGQRSTSITKNKCRPGPVTLPEHSTTEEMDTENHNSLESVALSAGGIVAVVIVLVFVVFIVICLALLTAVMIFTRKRRSRALKSTKSNEDPERKVQLGSSSEVSDTSESSQTKLLTPSNSPIVTPKQPAIAQSLENDDHMTNKSNTYNETQQQQCTHVQDSKLIYAELCTPVVSRISQPSSVEDTAYAVINHTDRTN